MSQTAHDKVVEVLLVEDDFLLREVLLIQLKVAGFSVRTASTGEAALAMILESQPAVLLLDLGLPDMSGLEVLSRLWEEHPSTNNMPVIIHSSSDPSAENQKRLSPDKPVTWITKTRACTDGLPELIRQLASR